ncbi:MAG: glycogen debranching protein, partial [Alphaproteobacteria bacterium]|nr:glycogen debranching protein [Alphaproteobacteria bacterium]
MTRSMTYSENGNVMWPLASGLAGTDTPVLLPIMAPRLQADCEPDGRITVSVWGVGAIATLSFTSLAAPYAYGPNLIEAANGGVYVAQSLPVMVIRGTQLQRLAAKTKAAWWHTPDADTPKPKSSRRGNRRTLVLAWGAVAIEQRGDDLVIAGGADLDEAQGALASS